MPVSLGARPDHDFGDPLSLLSDCHRRIERFLGMLQAAVNATDCGPLAPPYRQAVESAVNYFENAAPRHTADEEQSLFPRLRESAADAARTAIAKLDELEADHVAAAHDHQQVNSLARTWLANGTLTPEQTRQMRALLDRLAAMYARHIAIEDNELFPAARHAMDPSQIRQIGAEMAQRRGLGSV